MVSESGRPIEKEFSITLKAIISALFVAAIDNACFSEMSEYFEPSVGNKIFLYNCSPILIT